MSRRRSYQPKHPRRPPAHRVHTTELRIFAAGNVLIEVCRCTAWRATVTLSAQMHCGVEFASQSRLVTPWSHVCTANALPSQAACEHLGAADDPDW